MVNQLRKIEMYNTAKIKVLTLFLGSFILLLGCQSENKKI